MNHSTYFSDISKLDTSERLEKSNEEIIPVVPMKKRKTDAEPENAGESILEMLAKDEVPKPIVEKPKHSIPKNKSTEKILGGGLSRPSPKNRLALRRVEIPVYEEPVSKSKKQAQILPEASPKTSKSTWNPPRFNNSKSTRNNKTENTVVRQKSTQNTEKRVGFGLTRRNDSTQIVNFISKP